jgi:hypothetical protein
MSGLSNGVSFTSKEMKKDQWLSLHVFGACLDAEQMLEPDGPRT